MRRTRNILWCVWRGAWRPTGTLPRPGRWWHHIDYWARRIRDIIGGAFIFLIPPWLGFFVWSQYSSNIKAMLALLATVGSIWLFLVIVAYHAGKDPPS